MVSPVVRSVAAALLCLGPLAASAQTTPDVRQDLNAVGAALDRAVQKVSRPGARGFPLAGSTTRAYVLPGVGAVFVLAPRALPVARPRGADPQTARAVAEAIAHLQDSLRHVSEPELRAQIERSLAAVREVQSELQGGPRRGPWAAWGPLPMPEVAAEMDAAMAAHDRAMREAERDNRKVNRAFREQWEAEMQVLGAQTDAFRREAEMMQRQAELALRDQLRSWPELGEMPGIAAMVEPPYTPDVPAAPPTPSAAPAPPAAPALPAMAAPPVPAEPVPAEPAAPASPPVPPAMLAPPWIAWFEPDDGSEAADADTLVGNVRTAVLGVLPAQAPRLSRLAADDSVVVAVDFVPRAAHAPGSPRTLVLRVRKKDLDARQAGRLPAEEFARRVEIVQY